MVSINTILAIAWSILPFYLINSLIIAKSDNASLLKAIRWANANSMAIVDADKIKLESDRTGGTTEFHALDTTGKKFEIKIAWSNGAFLRKLGLLKETPDKITITPYNNPL